MDEISIVMTQFQNALRTVIESEIRRQVSQMAATGDLPVDEEPIKRRGLKPGINSSAKPCPVTGTLNTHRRFSYLMPEVRTPENLAKFKRGGK
jgi:hypothetical protein